jgi:hypothetical protein
LPGQSIKVGGPQERAKYPVVMLESKDGIEKERAGA